MISRADYFRLFHTLSDQYGTVNVERLLAADLTLKHSRKTKRITQVEVDGEVMLSLRTSDGRYLPTYKGSLWLLAHGLAERRVVVATDAEPFVAAGKSLFAKHVVTATDDIHAGDECFLFGKSDNLLAIGTSLHPTYALMDLESGVGVKIKHYNKAT